MRVFLTGATGFIGRFIVPELLAAGHNVLGLTRSEAGAQFLNAAGAEIHHGTWEDLDSLRAGAAQADAVIHAAFDHDFSNFLANCEKDGRAIEALGSALKGSARPLIITSGTGMGNGEPGAPATEDAFNKGHPSPRAASELAGIAMLDTGINVSVVRLPQVHDTNKQGLVSPMIAISREKGMVAYVGDGRDRWPAAHVSDVARLYRLAVEEGRAGARYHAVAEEGVQFREIAEAVGHGLKVPVVSLSSEEAESHFGWLAMFAGLDFPAASIKTRAQLNWLPIGPVLIDDLKRMDYFGATAS
jgi:nucleoside-diphosphate-sugar epimerase